MVKINGYYINLDTAQTRRERIEEHLEKLSWGKSYKRFTAETSEPEEARARGLTQGEYGLWKSWIKLLEHTIYQSNFNSYDYLHILEDDAIINKDMIQILSQLNPARHGIEILVTEMYTNEELWRAFIKRYTIAKDKNSPGMLLIYTGCLSSTLIPSQSIKKVYMELSREFTQSETLHPIDNTIVKLEHKNRLKVACTVPFLSHINQNFIINSNIQSFEESSTDVILTQQVNGLLRQQLSRDSNKEIYDEILGLIMELAALKKNDTYKTKLLSAALEIAQKEGLFRYRLDPRLVDAPNNPQNNMEAISHQQDTNDSLKENK